MITLEQVNDLNRLDNMTPFVDASVESGLWSPGERFISEIGNTKHHDIGVCAMTGRVDYSINEQVVPVDKIATFAGWLGYFQKAVARLVK